MCAHSQPLRARRYLATTDPPAQTIQHCPCDAGRLHFAKFESARVEDAIAFIEEKGLHRNRGKNGQREVRVIATGAQPPTRAGTSVAERTHFMAREASTQSHAAVDWQRTLPAHTPTQSRCRTSQRRRQPGRPSCRVLCGRLRLALLQASCLGLPHIQRLSDFFAHPSDFRPGEGRCQRACARQLCRASDSVLQMLSLTCARSEARAYMRGLVTQRDQAT